MALRYPGHLPGAWVPGSCPAQDAELSHSTLDATPNDSYKVGDLEKRDLPGSDLFSNVESANSQRAMPKPNTCLRDAPDL